MNLFNQIKQSIYSPRYYSEIFKESFGSSLKYFLMIILLASVVQATGWIYTYVSVGQGMVRSFVDNITSVYPEELEVTIKDGIVSTNVAEPYFITIPELENQSANLLVIDTKTPYSSSKFNEYKTAAWLSSDSLFVKESGEGKIRTVDLSGQKNLIINKALFDTLVSQIKPYLGLITPLVVIGSVLAVFMLNSLLLIYLLIPAAIIFLLLKIMKRSLSFSGSYKVALHAITLPLIISTVGSLIYLPGFTFEFTIITLFVVMINLASRT